MSKPRLWAFTGVCCSTLLQLLGSQSHKGSETRCVLKAARRRGVQAFEALHGPKGG